MQRTQIPSEAVLPPPANLPSSRRRLMQTQQVTACPHADFDRVRESAADHHVDGNDHSLQLVFADCQDNGTLANRPLIHTEYGFTAQDHAAYMNGDHHLERHTDADGPDIEAADDCLYYGDYQLQQQESTEAAHHSGKRGHSENVSVLRAKYGLSRDSFASYSDNHSDHHPIEQEVTVVDQHGSKTALALSRGKASKSHRAAAHNSRPHESRVEPNCKPVNHQLMPANNHKGSGITSSTLQAAQAQAAELRALHSAMLNNYGFSDRNTAAHNNNVHHYRQKQEDELLHISRPKMASKKSKSMVYSDANQATEVQNVLSGASSTSSIADCFIRPAHDYPIFTPSHEDMNTMNHRSSVDTCEALMREERLNYIFDHGNKRSFSGIQYSDRSKSGANVSCLHESLNLPPRSAFSLAANMQDKDDHLLHHKSLNLPAGSQDRLFTQNPLFDNFNPASEKKASHHLLNSLDWSSFSPSAKRIDDGNTVHSAVPTEQYASYEFKPAITGRQRALLEFLSEEPARMRAFNELAAMSDIGPHHMEKLQMRQTADRHEHNNARPSLAEGNLSNSRRIKGKYECTQNADHHQVSSRDNYLPRHQSMPHPSPIHDAPTHRDRVAHPHHSIPNAGVSFDKCRPVNVVPLTDLRDDHLPASTAPAAPKEKSDHQKKPFIMGWFFRGKKKHHNVDLSNDGGNSVASVSTSKDPRNPTTSAASASTTPEKQSNASLINSKGKHSSGNMVSTPHAAATTSSHVFPSLVNAEAEKELEVAIAMDLMELKILQANTKRDAAMAEVLELRLAMDSMAKKLMEVERHCEALRTQLIDVQALQHHADDQMLTDHPNNAHAAEMISTADQSNVQYSVVDPDAAENIAYIAEETDHYESDSIDHREERRPSDGISTIRAGLSSDYGNRNRTKGVQPTKAEFLNAVADSRVGIRQVSRVLLQHLQESKRGGGLAQAEPDHQKAGHSGIEEKGAEGTAGAAAGGLGKKGRDQRENWAPILGMCREAAKADKKAGMSGGMSASGSRGRGVAYCVEAVISMAFHEHFENVGFDKNGAHKILDPSQRSLAFYHSFLRLAKLTPTQLLTQPSPLYSSTFDNFCSRKMRALGRAVGCPGRLWPDELARTFLSAARAVWLLHHLVFAYHDRPPGIFRVAAHSSFDARFMEALPSEYRHVSSSSHLEVSLMVMPGFFLPDDIIKCKVLAS